MSVFSAPGPDGIVRPPKLPRAMRAANRVGGALRDVPREREGFRRYGERFGIEPEPEAPREGRVRDL